MYNTSSIVQHPVTEGVSLAFFGAPQKRLYVTSPAVGLIFDNIGYGQIALAVSEIGAGRVVALCDGSIIYDPMGFIYTADNLHLANNMIDWLSGAPCSHDLLAKLENPYDLEPGESTVLNATVDNRGLSDETNVTIQILVNDTLVNSVTIPELASRQSYTVSCPWTSPNAIVACNVTAYVQSIPNESVITNNARSRFVQVHYPLFEPAEGQFAYYTDCCYDKAGHLMYQFYQNFTYQNYVSAHEINVTLRYTSWDLEVPSGKVYVSNLIVDTMNRLVSGGGWSNFWYPMWVETNISQDSTVNLWDEPATVTASRLFKNVIDCWEIPYPTWYGKQVPLYDKVSGLLIKNEYVYSYNRAFDVHFPYYREVLRLIDTNIQLSTDERDVAVVNLTCPRAFVRQNLSVPINVTVDNQGVYPETANITVFANSTPIITRTCWLDIGDSAVTELNYEWNTTGFAYGNYTLEATVSLSEETNTSNNRCSNGWIIVSDPPVANFDLSPSLPRTGEQMTFDASSSLAGWNGTNTLVLYGWDFGDGSIIVTPSALIEHAYAVSTTYNVTLTVTDSGDMTDSTWQQVSVQIMGDVNDDGRVDMRDVGIAVAAFNSTPNHPRWNAAADLDRNGRIDMRDICRAITNFGKVG
jgi:PKD repeat protein